MKTQLRTTPLVEDLSRKHNGAPELLSVANILAYIPQSTRKTTLKTQTPKHKILLVTTPRGAWTYSTTRRPKKHLNNASTTFSITESRNVAAIVCPILFWLLVLNSSDMIMEVFRPTFMVNVTKTTATGQDVLIVVNVPLFVNSFVTTSLVTPQTRRNTISNNTGRRKCYNAPPGRLPAKLATTLYSSLL